MTYILKYLFKAPLFVLMQMIVRDHLVHICTNQNIKYMYKYHEKIRKKQINISKIQNICIYIKKKIRKKQMNSSKISEFGIPSAIGILGRVKRSCGKIWMSKMLRSTCRCM